MEGRGVNREGEDRSGHPQRHRDRHQQGHGRKVFLHLLPSQGQGLSDALQIVAKRTLGSGKQLTTRTSSFVHNFSHLDGTLSRPFLGHFEKKTQAIFPENSRIC